MDIRSSSGIGAGLKKSVAQTGAVTLVQRFGSALNLNIHFHMLFLDGVYSSNGHPKWFRQVKAPSRVELTRLTHTIAQRVGRYSADRMIQTAEWGARARLAEDRRKDLVKEHDNLVLAARTMEANRARQAATLAKQTERGLLITLGDVLFEFNKSELKAGGQRNLLPLAEVLKERTDQLIIIEGHTESIGNHAYNMSLSEKRAQAVEQYQVDQGVDVSRISTKGLGPDFPVAANATNEGRQRNRRVEVILPNLK